MRNTYTYTKKKCLQDILLNKVRILRFLLLLLLPYCEFEFFFPLLAVYGVFTRSIDATFGQKSIWNWGFLYTLKVGCQQFDYYRFIPHSKFIFKWPPPLIQCFITFHSVLLETESLCLRTDVWKTFWNFELKKFFFSFRVSVRCASEWCHNYEFNRNQLLLTS